MLKAWFIIGIAFLLRVKNKLHHSIEYIKAYWLRRQHFFRAILEHNFESPSVGTRFCVCVDPTYRSQDLKRSLKRNTGKNKCIFGNRNKYPLPDGKLLSIDPVLWVMCHITIFPNNNVISSNTGKKFPSFSTCCSLACGEQFLFNLKQNIVYVPVVEFSWILPVGSFMSPWCLI